MKNSWISAIQSTFFPSDTKLRIRFKRKIMFRETIVSLKPFTLVFCIPFPTRWTLVIAFIGLLVAINNITSFFLPLSVKGMLVYRSLKNSPLLLICQTNLWIQSVSGMDGAWGMLSESTNSSDLDKHTVIIGCTNFMAASGNSLRVWTTIWPDFTFWKMTFLTVPPMSSIGNLPWCLLL